jgi:preprotein translocase subunit YajC
MTTVTIYKMKEEGTLQAGDKVTFNGMVCTIICIHENANLSVVASDGVRYLLPTTWPTGTIKEIERNE